MPQRVVQRSGSRPLPGTRRHQEQEWTPLEPAVLEHEYYAGGIGTVKEVSVKGPPEELYLVSVG